MTKSEHINEYYNGRSFMLLCAVAMVAATVMALWMGVKPVGNQGSGIFFSLQGELFDGGALSAGVNLLCLLVTGAIILAVNKVYTFVRSMTHLFVSSFFLLQLAHPSGLVALNAGTLLSLVTAISVLPLFASYQDKHAQRSIFLIFAIVATGSMFHYGFVALLPAYLLCFLNMGALNLKGLLAMLFGLVTPFWIVLGLGIVSPSAFAMPSVNGIWNLSFTPQTNVVLTLAVLTAVTGIVLAVMNLMTIMNYRMQTRVYNAFFVFVLVMTVIALCIDYSDVAVFLPVLNLMVGVQVAHAHTLHTTNHHRYVFMVLLIVGCCAFCAASILLP